MRKRILAWVIILVTLLLNTSSIFITKPLIVAEDPLPTEEFIQNYLLREDGRISTDLSARQTEYLAETVGLWMKYLVLQNDHAQFDQQVDVLRKYFLTRDDLVAWQVKGVKKAQANAFIDDLRIIHALYEAGERWSIPSYNRLAKRMEKSLIRYQIRQQLFMDHVDLKTKDVGSQVTLSYLIPAGLERMKGHNYSQSRKLLVDAPVSAQGFFPKTYYMNEKKYSFDEEVNMIDQLYVGYHRAQWRGEVAPILEFILKSYDRDGKLYGRYDLNSAKPIVEYESVAVYALAILFLLEMDESESVTQLYHTMKEKQQDNPNLPYYGGYLTGESGATHIFDNVLALIAERKSIDAGIIQSRE